MITPTLKQRIELEARALGETVRAAMQQFADRTGMTAQVTQQWTHYSAVNDAGSRPVACQITVEMDGAKVTL